MHKMQERIAYRNVKRWANDFVKELLSIKEQNREILQRIVGKRLLNQIKSAYDEATSRLIMLDYDGTLSPFVKRPEDAIPSKQLMELLKKLSSDRHNKVVINSGRSHKILDQWLSRLPIDFAAEHGMFYKENGKWYRNIEHNIEWDEEILEIIRHTIDKTPNSHLEKKEAALVWHYRNVDVWLAELRSRQLINALIAPCARLNLQIIPGNKVVEIKPPDFNKGSEVTRRLKKDPYDFVLAIGDDTTDEDMFRALPADGISIKVGSFSPTAKYRIPLQSSVIPFLYKLIR